ncbi:MAG: patatin-like phospholipase family protein [Candidatus Thorarchaeota archaeon]
MKIKKNYDKNFKILSCDGGGLKGIMFLVFLAELENKLQKKCYEIFDLVIGTSTGGITAALIASGKSAKEILTIYIKNAKNIFKKRFLWIVNPLTYIRGSRYNRKFLDNLAIKELNISMKDLKCQLIVTGVNMRDARSTHFFKSYKEKYKNIPTYAPVMATYSAPTYFGYFKDKKNLLQTENKKGGVFSDGGVGIQTCTLLKSYIETKLQNKSDDYWILSCGCGYTNLNDYSDFLFSQIGDFLPIAREQSITEQINECKELNVNFNRIDIKIDKEYNDMDKPKNIMHYINYGKQLIHKYLNNLIEG